MKKVLKVIETIIVTPLCIAGGLLIGIIGFPLYFTGLVISDIWSF